MLQTIFEADIKNQDILTEFSALRSDNNAGNNDDSNQMVHDSILTGTSSSRSHKQDEIQVMSTTGDIKKVGFAESCRLIANGEVFPGLVFFHESTPLEDIVCDDDGVDANNLQNDLSEFENQKESNQKKDKIGENFGGVYGDKVDELDKFYRILANVDDKSDLLNFDNSRPSLYSRYTNNDLLHRSRERCDSQRTISSEALSCASSEASVDKIMKTLRHAHSTSPVSDRRTSCKISHTNSSMIHIWSWSCKLSKPMLLTREVYANCNSISNMKIIYPTTIELVGEALYNFCRCETVFKRNKYTAWEHVIRMTALLVRVISHGRNKFPGNKIIQRLLTPVFVALIFLDMGCIAYLTITYWCVWGDRTACDNHLGVALMHAIWPGALIMSPLMGLRVMILSSTGTVARQFVCWSRLACINCLVMLVIYLLWTDNADTFLNIPLLTYYACSRLVQSYYFDEYLAYAENKRTSRGWNGLYTSISNFEYHEFS